MESQLNHVENRLKMREKELLLHMEEIKSNQKLERTRLIGYYDALLLEKDEALLRFQNELEYLVNIFKNNQLNNKNTTNLSINDIPHIDSVNKIIIE